MKIFCLFVVLCVSCFANDDKFIMQLTDIQKKISKDHRVNDSHLSGVFGIYRNVYFLLTPENVYFVNIAQEELSMRLKEYLWQHVELNGSVENNTISNIYDLQLSQDASSGIANINLQGIIYCPKQLKSLPRFYVSDEKGRRLAFAFDIAADEIEKLKHYHGKKVLIRATYQIRKDDPYIRNGPIQISGAMQYNRIRFTTVEIDENF